MTEKLCDMHVHSNCSDSTLSPEELIAEAVAQGISAVALCDHNTTLGLSRFAAAAKGSGVIAVKGVEVTSAYEGKEVHILGLFLKDKALPVLNEYLGQIAKRKAENNLVLAKRLNAGGYKVDYNSIVKSAGEAVPNRVHFANELMSKGYVSSIAEAFKTVLAEGGAFYTSAERPSSLEVISFLNFVKALPVLAHPLVSLPYDKLCTLLPKAKAAGLAAMETIYPLYGETDTATAKRLAEEYGLLPSGGSDFHGKNKPDTKMGRGKDNILVPYKVYESLKETAIYR